MKSLRLSIGALSKKIFMALDGYYLKGLKSKDMPHFDLLFVLVYTGV